MKDEAQKQEPVRGWFTADEFVEMAECRTKEWAKQADIPDLIAGALGVSRGTAYDMMREALKDAAPVQNLPFGVSGGLVAIKTLLSRDPCVHANTAIEMIDAILKEHPAAPVQEPVGWWDAKIGFFEEKHFDQLQPLYTNPQPQREWVGLTDEEFEDIELGCRSTSFGKIEAMQKVEAKLKEKNSV